MALLSLDALALEVLVTRLFSVTLYYHYAFMVVSLSMLGIAAGGLWVYLRPRPDDVMRSMARASVGYAGSCFAATCLHLWLPQNAMPDALYLLINYVAFAGPFFFFGVFLSFAFSHHSLEIGRLYAADLLGAGLGAVAAASLLGPLDGPTALLVFAALGCTPALILGRARWVASVVATGLLVAAVSNAAWPWLRPAWIKGHRYDPSSVSREYWNAYSQVRVLHPERVGYPGWALGARREDRPTRYLALEIDAGAATWIIKDGLRNPHLSFLGADLSNLPYQLGPPAEVLVIGVGGGRDMLSALHFGARRVTGVEINPVFEELLSGPFFDYSGRLVADPRVRVVVDDGRAFLEAQPKRYDLIQLTLVDTWAATAAGAFVLAENSLYTKEAFRTYLAHLNPNGILAVARHSFVPPSQLLRVATTLREVAAEGGIREFPKHLFVARKSHAPGQGTGVCLFKRSVFSPEELRALAAAAQALRTEVVHPWASSAVRTPSARVYHAFVSAPQLAPQLADYPYDVAPVTDDQPFFFHMVRFTDVVRAWLGFGALAVRGPTQAANFHAVSVLFQLLILVALLTIVVVVLPLVLRHRSRAPGVLARVDATELVYFAAIGVGFMMVEIPLLQRFAVFLGHPVLSLAVVLSALLVFCGCGSALVHRIPLDRLRRRSRWLLGVVMLGVACAATLVDPALGATRALPLAGRVGLSVALLLPVAAPLGIAFPLGVRLMERGNAARIPWYWGINGACSVLGSVAVMAIALFLGFRSALLLGASCYLAAWLAWERRRGGSTSADRRTRIAEREASA